MKSKRIQSVDVLRGITIVAMILVNNPGDWGSVYKPLLHAEWHGLTPTDLIFPFFLFIVGISISFAYNEKKPTKEVYKKILIRSLKLIGLGLFLNLFLPYLPFIENYTTFRIPGVLQRIGIAFFVTSILFLNFNWKILALIIVSILVGYFVFLGFIPFSDGSLPTFDRSVNNWSNYVDTQIFGSHMWKKDYDPEGFLSTIPSIATCLLGVLTGQVLKLNENYKKEYLLIFFSTLLLIIGYIWNIWFPINKAIWSSSFVLVTAGWGIMILAFIYYVIDVKSKNIGNIFKYVGTNAITVFFLSSFIAKSFYLLKINQSESIHSWLYQNFYQEIFLNAKLASLLYALTVVGCYVLLGYILFKKKIFIKV